MEIVVAMLMIITGSGEYKFVAEKKIPIEECLTDAYKINSDPETPYVMVCAPDITVPRFES